MPPPRSNSVLATANVTSCRVAFGSSAAAAIRILDGSPVLSIGLPVLGGRDIEEILDRDNVQVRERGEDRLIVESADRVAGFFVARPEADLETAARELYQQVFAATTGAKLYRVWNYVPAINRVEHGLENYRRFCRGRSHAFEEHFGRGFQRALPAASAVGALHQPLAVAFVGGADLPRHFENPQQVPAFEYPPLYGPRPPSFSRATLIATAAQRELYISGTAAIRGHATVAADDLVRQLACTRENLSVIAAIAGAGERVGFADGWQRSFKVYIRHDTDLLQVRNDLERHLLHAHDEITYLQADLCRADLRVEIEAVLTKRA